MNEKELMIGDWVSYEGQPIKVRKITDKGKIYVEGKLFDVSQTIKPLCLYTIVENENNGFKWEDSYTAIITLGEYTIRIDGEVISITQEEICRPLELRCYKLKCSKVHQFQNILRFLNLDFADRLLC